MKKLTTVMAIAILAGGLTACNTPEERAVGGGLLGAATGAALGAAVTGRGGGALAGAAIGGLGGALLGAGTTPRQAECAQWGRDYYGNPVCMGYY